MHTMSCLAALAALQSLILARPVVYDGDCLDCGHGQGPATNIPLTKTLKQARNVVSLEYGVEQRKTFKEYQERYERLTRIAIRAMVTTEPSLDELQKREGSSLMTITHADGQTSPVSLAKKSDTGAIARKPLSKRDDLAARDVEVVEEIEIVYIGAPKTREIKSSSKRDIPDTLDLDELADLAIDLDELEVDAQDIAEAIADYAGKHDSAVLHARQHDHRDHDLGTGTKNMGRTVYVPMFPSAKDSGNALHGFVARQASGENEPVYEEVVVYVYEDGKSVGKAQRVGKRGLCRRQGDQDVVYEEVVVYVLEDGTKAKKNGVLVRRA